MGKRLSGFFENFILIAIILVLIQTFLEDLAVLLSWSWTVRRTLIISGFAFDLLFSIEFIIRLVSAFQNGGARKYLFENRGWIDLLASIPLLLLNSGPGFFAVMSGSATLLGVGGVLNVLKVIKAIRIARILRLLRVLKIFRRIKHTDSVMAQRHSAKISTIAVGSLVFTLLVMSVLEGFIGGTSIDERYEDSFRQTTILVANALSSNDSGALTELADKNAEMISVVYQDDQVYQRWSDEEMRAMFGPGDYVFVPFSGTNNADGVFFNSEIIRQTESMTNLRYFIIIIVLLFMYLFIYSPHFAITISDPIQVMKRGFLERAYNLEVRIPEEIMDDEVFELGASYNEVYLPLKDRASSQKDSQVLDIKMDDIQDMVADLSDEQFTYSDSENMEDSYSGSSEKDNAVDSEDLDDDLAIFAEDQEEK